MPDEMIPHGAQSEQRAWCGLTATQMVAHARALLGRPAPATAEAEALEAAGRAD